MLSMILRLFGPLVFRELVEISRRRSTYVLRCGVAFAMFVVLIIASTSFEYRWETNPIRKSTAIGSEFVTTVLVIQFMLVVIFVPVFVANLIAGERERGSLDLLLTTPLSSREILFGLYLGRLLSIGSNVLVSLGFISMAIAFYAGVSWEILLRTYAVTAGTFALFASMTAYFSATSKSTISTMLTTYMTGFVLFVVVPIVLTSVFATPAWTFAWLCSPFFLFTVAFDESSLQWSGFPLFPNLFWGMIGVYFLVALALVTWAAFRLRRVEWSPSLRRKGKQGTSALSRLMMPVRWLKRAITWTKRDESSTHINVNWDRVNPLWLRARLGHPWDRDSVLLRSQIILCFTYIGLLGLFLSNRMSVRESAYSLPIVLFVVRMMTVIAFSASLPVDAKRGFLDQMLVTPLRRDQFVDGVFWGSLEHLLFLLIVGSFVLAAFALLATHILVFFLMIYAILQSALICQVATLFACHTKSTMLAFVCSFFFLMFSSLFGMLFPFVLGASNTNHEYMLYACAFMSIVCLTLGLFLLFRRPGSFFANVLGVNLFWFAGINLLILVVDLLLGPNRKEEYVFFSTYPMFWDACLADMLSDNKWTGPFHDVAEGLVVLIILLNCALVFGMIRFFRWYTIRYFDLWAGRISDKAVDTPLALSR